MSYESSTSQEFLATAEVAAWARDLEIRHGTSAPMDEEQQQDHNPIDKNVPRLESKRSVRMNAQNPKAVKEQAESMIPRKETKAVFRLKLLVIAVLAVSVVGVCFGVYYYKSMAEHHLFESRYHDAADKVLESFGTTLHLSLGAADSAIVNFVSFARYSNMTWPFVTIPNFAVRVAKIRSLSHAFVVQLHPLVLTEQRAEWETYVGKNDGWVQESMNAQQLDTTYQGRHVENGYGSSDYSMIHNDTGPSGPVGPYAPQWQSYPILPYSFQSTYNWNGAEFCPIRAAWEEIFLYNRIVIGQVTNLPTNATHAKLVKNTNAWIKNYLSPEEDETEPQSDIYYPILNTSDQTVQSYQGATGVFSKATARTVSFLTLSVRWREFLKSILPTGTNGVVVVIGNVCQQNFTYQINGPNVKYLGPGDCHETKFDQLRRESSFLNLTDTYSTNNANTGLGLADSSCPYWIHVYPSQDMQAEFVSHKPIIVGVCSALVTSVVFLAYHFLLERRQRLILGHAIRLSATVSSLLPLVVRERLFQTDDDVKTEPQSDSDNKFIGLETNKNNVETIGQNNNENSSSTDQGASRRTVSAATTTVHGPIVDSFTDTTVMFANIAGFTEWSSNRHPSQVFTLLEPLYGEFDRIATRRKVFRVETVGDSYVAVAGMPEPRDDHAVCMVQFARDCLVTMARVTQELEPTLGSDTLDLALCIGLHSGPVTDGVLRGQQQQQPTLSRFQLFGDTVNTCSRMEKINTSLCNCIQISQTTADLLTAAGKGHWVEAKGKGVTKTYWVESSSSIDDTTHCEEEAGRCG